MTAAATARLAGRRAVVVGGGAVGRLVVELLESGGATATVVDRAPTCTGRRVLVADVTALPTEPAVAAALGAADVVVLAVPEPVALAALDAVLDAMRPGALLVDTLSVKGDLAAATAGAPRVAALGLEVLGLNPMFAPALGLAGRPVAAVPVRPGPRTEALLALLTERGGQVVRVSAAEHDRLAAITQALTHAAVLAFGLAAAELTDELADDLAGPAALAPPPHRTLLALLARIAGGAPEVYWDVQAANPQAAAARQALIRAARRLADVADRGDEAGFGALLDRVRTLLGPRLGPDGELCARLFGALRD